MISSWRLRVGWLAALVLALLLAGACAERKTPTTERRAEAYSETGIASWYGKRFHGRRTASGERFDMHARTAAHRKLAFGSVVRVTDVASGKSVKVRINDRGPFGEGRIIDLSYAAARELGILERGLARVQVTVVDRPRG